ncbi:MAG: hypothetical protein HQK66_15270 [Desulfamplus sp.]|nr:hypothetical protein [Desulfamplus sp.]
MDNDKKLLLEQWVDAYKKVPEETVKKIKEEIKMSYVATTITEHYIHQGEMIGEKRGVEIGEKRGVEIGEKRGVKIGKIRGKIDMLDNLLKSGMLPPDKYQEMVMPLMEELKTVDLARETTPEKEKRVEKIET